MFYKITDQFNTPLQKSIFPILNEFRKNMLIHDIGGSILQTAYLYLFTATIFPGLFAAQGLLTVLLQLCASHWFVPKLKFNPIKWQIKYLSFIGMPISLIMTLLLINYQVTGSRLIVYVAFGWNLIASFIDNMEVIPYNTLKQVGIPPAQLVEYNNSFQKISLVLSLIGMVISSSLFAFLDKNVAIKIAMGLYIPIEFIWIFLQYRNLTILRRNKDLDIEVNKQLNLVP